MPWAWIELTPWGHGLVDNAEFSFFSREYDYADFVRTVAGAEPSRLAGCTLTNSPRHKQQVPCTNMAALRARACATQTIHTTQTTMNDSINERTRPAPPWGERGNASQGGQQRGSPAGGDGSHTYPASVLEPPKTKSKSYTVTFTLAADHSVLETYYPDTKSSAMKQSGKQLWPKTPAATSGACDACNPILPGHWQCSLTRKRAMIC